VRGDCAPEKLGTAENQQAHVSHPFALGYPAVTIELQ
jgi:hypothetical protein